MTPWDIRVLKLIYMPLRIIPLVNGQYYHIFNRSINKEPIFTRLKDCQRAIFTMNYYRFKDSPLKLAYFLALGFDVRNDIMVSLIKTSKTLVDIICYCLMPNHFHILLKQNEENGISRFFNTKHSRQGHLFQGQFKAVRIEDEEQLIHVSRYIHLNPYSSFVVKTITNLKEYRHSSLKEYLDSAVGICKKEIVTSLFSKKFTYEKFVFDSADYQRKLNTIKHLAIE